MNTISTTIKRKYLDRILSGEKNVEYKGATPYWKKRLEKNLGLYYKDLAIVFVCSQEAYRFTVTNVVHRYESKVIDGVRYESYYAIHLGRLYIVHRKRYLKPQPPRDNVEPYCCYINTLKFYALDQNGEHIVENWTQLHDEHGRPTGRVGDFKEAWTQEIPEFDDFKFPNYYCKEVKKDSRGWFIRWRERIP